MFPPDFIAARWHVIRDYLAFPPPPRYIGIIFINLWGSCGNLLLLSRVFPLLAYVCRVSRSTTAAVRRRGGGWLGSGFLRPLGRHPPRLPARLVSLRLALFGVIVDRRGGAEFPMSPGGPASSPSDCLAEVQRHSQPVLHYLFSSFLFCLFSLCLFWKSETVACDIFVSDYPHRDVSC